MKSKDITIMITTYNRKQRLLNMLLSIERQGRWGEYKLLIVDNCSPDYNWDEMLLDFHQEFRDNIEIERRSFNCGMSCNISTCFLFVKTKWVLFLSDDDEMIDGGLDIVLNDIEKYHDAGAIKYTIQNFQSHKDIEIDNIDSYIRYYKEYKQIGDIAFLTMLYNIEKLKPYLGLITSYAYTYISFNLPLYAGLAEKKINLKLSSKSILRYIYPEKNTAWDKIDVLLGISTFLDINLQLAYRQQLAIYKLIISNFKYYHLLRTIFRKECTKEYKNYLFKKILNLVYKPIDGKSFILFYLFYKLKYCFHFDIFNFYDKIKKMKCYRRLFLVLKKLGNS